VKHECSFLDQKFYFCCGCSLKMGNMWRKLSPSPIIPCLLQPYLETSLLFTQQKPLLETELQLYLPKVLHSIVCDYAFWFVKEGSLVDVQGASNMFDMFVPSPGRWDVCRIEQVTDKEVLVVRPIHRSHMFPYLYKNCDEIIQTRFPIYSDQIQPFMSRVKRVEVKDLKQQDLVAVQDDKEGTWKVAEVIDFAIGFIWVQYPARYTSPEHKASLREWISFPSDRLAKF